MLGFYGGTFDPIHLGHMYVAFEVKKQLNLSKIFFIPNSRPPHKVDSSYVSYAHRKNMLELAIKGFDGLDISDIEADEKIHYTIDTLRILKAMYPKEKLYFIIGEDSLRDLDTWRNPQFLGRYASLVVFARIDRRFEDKITLKELSDIYRERYDIDIITLSLQPMDIASNQIRERIRSNKSVEGLLPNEVEEYIIKNELYIFK